MQQSLLQVDDLRTTFSTFRGPAHVVNRISFRIEPGESLGIVGESGSGKTMTSLSIMDLVPQPQGKITGGSISFDGRDLRSLSNEERRQLRGGAMSMIFQDPMSSLSPFYSVGFQIREAIQCHQDVNKHEANVQVIRLLNEVGIPDPEKRIKQYPHEFSGGMRQRIMIAMALANDPRLLIADEPTTALDVTIQAQVLALIRDKTRERNMSLLIISHDWGVISAVCDRVCVMYAGKIVEEGSTQEIWREPKHPYTQALLSSVPHWDTSKEAELFVIPGNPPSFLDDVEGCPFAPRCSRVLPECYKAMPPEKTLGDERRRYLCVH